MKVLDLFDLAERLKKLKAEGKTVVHAHGCFDLMHPGHIKHLQAAKEFGDVLVVTITPDEYIDKGPDRPVFNQALRADSLAALSCVDYVAVNKWPTAEETLRTLRPDIYVKGQEFEHLEDKTGKIQKEFEVVKEIGARLMVTHEVVFSSTKLLNEHFLKKSG
ncbi:MAG: adenylyltransferase/cytidyltransferase family protein [Deltaproteobacteria bacterium]|nr:adenylyltransferase/cytidyltransferase family protein [Deltaproteobacteria bacterium]